MAVSFLKARCATVLLLSGLLAGSLQAAENAGFVDIVSARAASWDQDHDGALTVDEMDTAIHNAQVKGDEAVALVVLRRAAKTQADLFPLPVGDIRERLMALRKTDRKAAGAANMEDGNLEEKIADGYDGQMKQLKEKLVGRKQELFVSGKPNITRIRQGRIGNCFMLAATISFVNARPQALEKMITVLPDHRIAVEFGDSSRVVINPPTDGEIVLGAVNGNDGMWLNVLEVALGQLLCDQMEKKIYPTPLARLTKGGSPGPVLEIYTGKKFKRIPFKDFQQGTLSEQERQQRLDEINQEMTSALAKGQILVTGTPGKNKQVIVPGLAYNHSYGVLKYDPATRMLTLRNPFGNTFTPKGEPGLKNGYPTVNGEFTLPLSDAVMWLGSMTMTTDEKATKS